MPHLYVTSERIGRNVDFISFQVFNKEGVVFSHFFREEDEWIHPWFEEGEEYEIEFEVYPKYGRRAPLRRVRWYRIKLKFEAPKFLVR